MAIKVVGVVALVLFPFSVSLWHRSHKAPQQYRYDLTLYKSLRVYLKDGICGLRVLSMPTKTGGKSDFRASLSFDMIPGNKSFLLRSRKEGVYRITWLVFPFWLTTCLLSVALLTPVFRGPVRRWRRKRAGCCLHCGYSLTGNRSGRCPECGLRFN